LLVMVAKRLQEFLRPEDTVARIGGDEFVILLESIHHIGDATSVAERIRDDLATPLPLADSPVNASVSIGIVQSSPVHQSPEQLLNEADAAMYRAKRSGGGRYEVYDPEQLVPVAHTVGDAELRHALERDELRLHYQPVVELATRKIVGLEALLRWEHPERGLLHPGEFIPIAEAGDLTRQIGEWSLNEACRQLADWYERYGERAPRWISVNLSEKYFLDPALGSTIQRLLSESRLPVGALRVEISEAAIAEGDDPKLSALSVLSEI